MFLSFAFFLAGDTIFFRIFNNHLGTEIFTSFTHIGFFVQMAFQTYYYITLPLFLLFALTIYFTHKYINRYEVNKPDPRFLTKSIVLLICMIPFFFFTLKGKLQIHGRNIGAMDAQVLANARAKDLILNGLYTALNAVRKHQKRTTYFENPAEGLPLITPQEKQTDPAFAFERQRIIFNKPNKNYNFVLFMLESFDPTLIEEYPEVIPHFMQLKNNGTYYSNFFSSGSRSLIGVTATLFSVPYVWGSPTMKTGLGGKEFSRLATYFHQKGYSTLNIITDISSSDNANLMASYMGFDKFFSKSDIPLTHTYPSFHKGFDYEGLEFLLHQINAIQRPFFAYFYTSTLHNPYNILVSKDYQPYPMDSELHQFLNRAAYTDAALGHFFEQARQEPWFKDTIFLFLPDHRAPLSNRKPSSDITSDKFHSFLLMYGADIPAQTKDVFGNQEDILPTLLDLLNSSESYAASGQSLLDPYRMPNKFIFEENDNIIHVVGPTVKEVVSEASLQQITDLSAPVEEALRFNEAIYKSLRDSTWKKK
jgi:phosphoglycerol transferase MdoB-like AlkP superfamily enzyme